MATVPQRSARSHRPIQSFNPRILVLGSTVQRASVTSYLWNDLPKQLNIGDFDVIVLNLVALSRQQTIFDVQPERLPSWQQMARFFFSPHSEIVCLGLPDADPFNSLYQSLTWWLPAMPDVVLEQGNIIQTISPEFDYYFDAVQSWFFYIQPRFKPHFLGLETYLRQIHPYANQLQVGLKAIARNRVQQPIAFQLMFRVTQVSQPSAWAKSLALPTTDGPAPTQPMLKSGKAIWLPPPTEISIDDAIDRLLQRRYGLLHETFRPPNWLTDFTLPRQRQLEAQLLSYHSQVDHLNQQIKTTQHQLEQVAAPVRLLCESNPNVLAQLVSNSLRNLGAQVSELKPDGQAVLRITTPHGQEGIMLVRARAEHISLLDLQELDRWVRDLMLHRGWHGKGLLLGNAFYGTSPQLRPDSFPPNCVRAAEQFGYGLISSTQLFQAIALHQNQQLALTQFWAALFNSSGICPLPDLQSPQQSS